MQALLVGVASFAFSSLLPVKALSVWLREPMHGLLLTNKEGEARCVPRMQEEPSRLGDWLAVQQQWTAYSRGALTPERAAALEAAGVVWDPLEATWERMYGLLLAYREREGQSEVPRAHREEG